MSVSTLSSGNNKVFTTTQGGKVTFHVTTSTASAPRKPVIPTRGVPPPVPPNKPALPPKKTDGQPIHLAGSPGVKFGITISTKDKVAASSDNNESNAAAAVSPSTPQVGEALQQELADFNQVLNSMSPGNTPTKNMPTSQNIQL